MSSNLVIEIPDTRPEVLATRVKKGIEIANNIWQQDGYTGALENVIGRLKLLYGVSREYGVNQCVFGNCKFSDDFICFVCTRED